MVIEALQREELPRVTLDFDGSVQSTKCHADGTAVGFNKTQKGAWSYYPLFCTVAQTGQFFDLFHRPGTVHDSNGAVAFMAAYFTEAKAALKNTIFESRVRLRLPLHFLYEALSRLLVAQAGQKCLHLLRCVILRKLCGRCLHRLSSGLGQSGGFGESKRVQGQGEQEDDEKAKYPSQWSTLGFIFFLESTVYRV